MGSTGSTFKEDKGVQRKEAGFAKTQRRSASRDQGGVVTWIQGNQDLEKDINVGFVNELRFSYAGIEGRIKCLNKGMIGSYLHL